jgi:hypothetical protein
LFWFFLKIVAKGKSIFAQHVEKMKGTSAGREIVMDANEKTQQAGFEDLNHQFGKKCGHIICTVIHVCVICN